jgi:hypothetical protein
MIPGRVNLVIMVFLRSLARRRSVGGRRDKVISVPRGLDRQKHPIYSPTDIRMRRVECRGENVGPGEDSVKFGRTRPITARGTMAARNAFAT